VFLVASVNEPEGGWFGEYVVSNLLEHSEESWHIEVHSPRVYNDGEEGAPNVYVIRKNVSPKQEMREATKEQRGERYTIKRVFY
jgi:hypothetical protein